MMVAISAPPRIVLYEGIGSEPLAEKVRFEVAGQLLARGYRVARVRPQGRVAAHGKDHQLVLGRFAQMPAELEGVSETCSVTVRPIDGLSAEQIIELVETTVAELAAPKRPAWKPWFPVIDYDRCTNCMQCLSFCLFDVYGVSADAKIQVQNQSNCKTDCPACSRVCPEVAILFPKYKAGPINGAEIDADDLRREAMKVDISALLGGDIYSMLRDRSAKAKSRFSKERDDERALKERQRCLAKLQAQMDIPAEVFATLPSAEEIQKKAEQARVRAAEATLAASQLQDQHRGSL
jgi:NAD-dependent dihydropyrimidine dehydrogenase PreA subunit